MIDTDGNQPKNVDITSNATPIQRGYHTAYQLMHSIECIAINGISQLSNKNCDDSDIKAKYRSWNVEAFRSAAWEDEIFF